MTVKKLDKKDIDTEIGTLTKLKGEIAVTEAIEGGEEVLANTVANNKDKRVIIVPYKQQTRDHWVTIKITQSQNTINVELIDSKGGAIRSPSEVEKPEKDEVKKSFFKKFKDKIKNAAKFIKNKIKENITDPIGGLIDGELSYFNGKIDLASIKRELEKVYNPKPEHNLNPEPKPKPKIIITTTLTQLETQRDSTSSGHHTIENITNIANGRALETDMDKANTNILKLDERIKGKIEEKNHKSVEVDKPHQQAKTELKKPKSMSFNSKTGMSKNLVPEPTRAHDSKKQAVTNTR